MKAKLSSAFVYELWQYSPEVLWLTGEEDGITDPDKAMHNHDPSIHTTGAEWDAKASH